MCTENRGGSALQEAVASVEERTARRARGRCRGVLRFELARVVLERAREGEAGAVVLEAAVESSELDGHVAGVRVGGRVGCTERGVFPQDALYDIRLD